MSKQVIPECFADTVVISTLGYKKPNHQQSIGDVINTLNKHHLNKVGIGFIDSDKSRKGQEEHTQYTVLKKEGNLVLKRKNNTNQYLIMHPNLESWLINIATDLNIDFKSIPNNAKKLAARIKNENLEDDKDFKEFINTLCQKKNSPFKTIKTWIDELID